MTSLRNKIMKGKIITNISKQKTHKGKTLLHQSFQEFQHQRNLVPFLDFTCVISILQDQGGELMITDSKIENSVRKAVCQRNSKVTQHHLIQSVNNITRVFIPVFYTALYNMRSTTNMQF